MVMDHLVIGVLSGVLILGRRPARPPPHCDANVTFAAVDVATT
jgi:hypothetical protein